MFRCICSAVDKLDKVCRYFRCFQMISFFCRAPGRRSGGRWWMRKDWVGRRPIGSASLFRCREGRYVGLNFLLLLMAGVYICPLTPIALLSGNGQNYTPLKHLCPHLLTLPHADHQTFRSWWTSCSPRSWQSLPLPRLALRICASSSATANFTPAVRWP